MCHVYTGVDMLTDEEHYSFACERATDTFAGSMYIGVTVGQFNGQSTLFVMLTIGLQAHMGDTIPIAIRVDKGPLIKREAQWAKHRWAFVYEEQLARSLLHDLAHGQRVVIQIGKDRGSIPLNGARQATDDFRQRAGLSSQQTLTIPPIQPQQTLTPEQRKGAQGGGSPSTRQGAP